MFTRLLKIIKKIIFSILLLYGLNIIIGNLGIYIPINIYSITIISILGVPGLLLLLITFFIIN